MKLPTDKKERTKILAMIGIGVLVVIVVAVMFGVMPALKSRTEKIARIAELKEELEKADKEIKKISGVVAKNREILTKIGETSDKYLLKPVLNNYLLAATEIIEPKARKAGVKIAMKDSGLTDVAKLPGQKASWNVKCYTARITAECGYNDLVKLLDEIADINPYFCIVNVTVMGQPTKDVAKHTVIVEAQWPAWADPAMPANLDAKLAKLDEDAKSEEKSDSNAANTTKSK